MTHQPAVWSSLLGLALAGCVVDVDLGRSPIEAPPIDAASPPEPELDAIPIDAAPTPLDDVGPEAAPPADAGMPLDAAPDAGPEFIETCAECIDLLAVTADCGGELPCAFDPFLIEACGQLCVAPDDGSCEGCFDGVVPLLEACDEFAPIDICDALQIELLSRCDARCGADGCVECLDGVLPACFPVEPFACGEGLANDFAVCFDACDGPLIFDGMSCAIDAADAWALCSYAGGELCDEPLSASVELCRLLVTGQGGECFETCSALAGPHADVCRQLGGDALLCEARGSTRIEACFSSCQQVPWEACDAAARAREHLCVAGGGGACAGLRQAISTTCSGEFEAVPCQDCLLRGLAAYSDCGDVSECLPVLEDEWAFCLDGCGQTGPSPGCLDCGLAGDDQLGRCMLDGTDPVSCIAERDRQAEACAADCGDALPRALPCSVRTQALWDGCPLDPEGDPLCFEAGAVFDAACRWARLGIE